MRRRSQAGVTTVELIITMAITAIVLVAASGVLGVANQAYGKWQQPLSDASAAPILGILASSIQADSHVYNTCSSSAAELDFCVPGGAPGDPAQVVVVVRYKAVPSAAGNNIVRYAGAAPGTSMEVVPRLGQAPSFHVFCQPGSTSAPILTGRILVTPINYNGPKPDVTVFFDAPVGGCSSV